MADLAGVDGDVGGVLGAPDAQTIAPTAITLARIATTLVFTFRASLTNGPDVFNRLVTGLCDSGPSSLSRSPNYAPVKRISRLVSEHRVTSSNLSGAFKNPS